MNKNSKCGSVIKELLILKGLKQSWLASKLNISRSALSQRLSRDIGIEFTFHILNMIGSSIEEFNIIYKQKEDAAYPTTNRNVFPQRNMNA